MTYTAGIDIGSTYTKCLVLDEDHRVMGQAMRPTGFGRHQLPEADAHVTDLTAAARGACLLFPGTSTILNVGGQTMKATKVGDDSKVESFRLNDKCAAGTGAFLEKTARYMGYETTEGGCTKAELGRGIVG